MEQLDERHGRCSREVAVVVIPWTCTKERNCRASVSDAGSYRAVSQRRPTIAAFNYTSVISLDRFAGRRRFYLASPRPPRSASLAEVDCFPRPDNDGKRSGVLLCHGQILLMVIHCSRRRFGQLHPLTHRLDLRFLFLEPGSQNIHILLLLCQGCLLFRDN